MDFFDVFNTIDFAQIFVEHKNQLVLFQKPIDQFSLLIGLYLYDRYNIRLI